MRIEGKRQALFFATGMFRHEGIPADCGGLEGRASPVANAQELLHAVVFLSCEFEWAEFRLTREIVLVYGLIVESTGVDFKEFIAGGLIVNYVGVRYLHIMDHNKTHSHFMFVVESGEAVVELSHLTSEMATAQRCVHML